MIEDLMRTPIILFVSAAALAAQPAFVRDVLPVFEKADCAGCHQLNGVASTTRLLFPEKGASPDELEGFGDSLRALVDTRKPEDSLLLAKPTMRVKHGGGPRIKVGSPEEAALRQWVDHLVSTAPVARRTTTRAAGSKTVLRRLTHSQYDNTVRDLLGDRTFPSRQFPPEDFIDGFKNQYQGQSISPILADNYAAAAEKLASNWEGKDPGPQFVRQFGKRVFRRPLTPEEETRYGALYKQGKAKLALEAMLQSPAFLYRSETAATPELRSYVRASRLSYLLWDTTPDDALIASAERGELNTAEGVETVARRMLADPRARQAADEFIAQWFRFDSIVTMVKERRAFPLFNRELALAMTEETRRLASELIWSNRSFMEFYTANYTFLNSDLAALYKLPVPADEFAKVTFPDTIDRGGGVLGHGSFLSLTSKPADTSITARGLFVREHILCQQVPQPPPGVNTNLPSAEEGKALTNKDKLKMHLSNPSCASCHNLIDPIGFGLEKFDGSGARREKARVELPKYNRRLDSKFVDADIDNAGWVTGIANSEFKSPKELGPILAANPQCQECVVKQYFRYAMGRHETAADRPVIERITARFRDSGFKFQDMIVALVRVTEEQPK
jgi:mono/diheme cytochrome c family protein